MTRMTADNENRRAGIENALTSISTVSILLDHQVRLRIRQAMERDNQMIALLGPTVAILDRTQQAIDLAKSELSGIWHIGESQQWEEDFYTLPIGQENSSSKNR